MKNSIKDYFTFNSTERNGVIVLLFLMIVIPGSISFFSGKQKEVSSNDSLFRVESEAFLAQIKHEPYYSDSISVNYRNKFKKKVSKEFKPHNFDPNTASIDEYIQMGFSEKQAGSIIKYRNHGGVFKTKEDFSKLYVVDDFVYNTFEPFISIINQQEPLEVPNQKYEKKAKKLVELNAADSLQLLSINGIGPVFASRIMKYREKLGGFLNKAQLMEIYGLDSTRYPDIAMQVTVDTLLISKININKVSLNELRKHPYFRYSSAKSVIDKRIQKGRINSINEIKAAFKDNLEYSKVKPYLCVN